MIAKDDNSRQEIIYNPSALMHVFNNALTNDTVRKTFAIKGRYVLGKGVEYNGYYYDILRDEASEATMTFIVPSVLRNKLQPDQTIECHAFLTKKVQLNGGRIDLQINLIDILSQKKTEISEEELKAVTLLQQKAQQGFKDVDSFIKNRIINGQRIKVAIITGKTGIIDSDIKHQLKEAIAFYDFQFIGISLTGELEIIQAIKTQSQLVDIVCISRGGGENVDFFNKSKITEAVISLKTLFITAIGHKEDISLLQKVADKAFITPTALGQYFHDIYSQTVEELQKSKAKLVEQITVQLKANYEKQILNLTDKQKATELLFEKAKEENRNLHTKELEILRKQIENIKNQHQTELNAIKKLNDEKERFAKEQIASIKNQQQESSTSYGWIIIVVIIVVLLVLMKGCDK